MRRFIAKRLLRFGIRGAKWAEALALWIDPTLEVATTDTAEVKPP